MEPYDLIVSLGGRCAPAANIRRRFHVNIAMPFDWWVSPYRSTIKLLEEQFSNLLRSENLEIIQGESESVRCNHYGILHHHDFIRDTKLHIVPDINSQLPHLVEKYRFITDRFLRAFEGKRALFIRSGLYGDTLSPPTAEENYDRAITLHSMIRRNLSPSHVDIVVLSNVPSGTTLSLEGGNIIFEQLGDKIGDHVFCDANYDLLFERLGTKLVDRI
jgi:hypothetical protein